jgi:hypothetical protein
MNKAFRWIWVIHEPFNGEDGYVLGQSLLHYTNRVECIKAAKKWLETHDNYDVCTLTRGPYLIVETLEGDGVY